MDVSLKILLLFMPQIFYDGHVFIGDNVTAVVLAIFKQQLKSQPKVLFFADDVLLLVYPWLSD